MIGYLKYQLRALRSKGKFTRFIRVLVIINYHLKSIKQRVQKKQVERSLIQPVFGDTPDEWFQYIWNSNNGFFRPIQQPQEILELITLISKRAPNSVLEIGTANGGSLFLFCRAATDNATVVSIDLPAGINGGGYPKWKSTLYQKLAKQTQQLHLLRNDSHLESTQKQVSTLTPTGKFDMIMIDADHSYEGVKMDFNLYSELVSDGGVIVLHDIIKNRFDPSIQVDRFWDEVKKTYTTQEIIFNEEQGNMGIGMVFF